MKTLLCLPVIGPIAFSTALAAASAPVSPPAAAKEKTHSLFMGVDVSVEKDKTYHPVRDVAGKSWVINVAGRPEFIPTQRSSLNLKVEHALKLTDASATLGNLKTERAYTPANDPQNRSLSAQVQMAAFATESVMASERQLIQAQTDTAFREAAINNGGTPIGPAPDIEGITDKMMKMEDLAAGELTSRRFHENIAQEQAKAESYDAIAIEFDVSAEKTLSNPYLIVVAEFGDKREAPGTARNWIYAQSLEPIDATPRKVSLLRGGFPPGYELRKVEVHLYNRGQEVATNVSPKRVSLTSDEAFQYLVVEHISGHKGATMPAMPAMARLPTDLATRLAAGQGQAVYYVKVSKDGYVIDAYEDADYAKAIEDPFFSGIVKRIWFKPALENGKPVAAKTSVDLTKLRL
jgi:hypothetical protein